MKKLTAAVLIFFFAFPLSAREVVSAVPLTGIRPGAGDNSAAPAPRGGDNGGQVTRPQNDNSNRGGDRGNNGSDNNRGGRPDNPGPGGNNGRRPGNDNRPDNPPPDNPPPQRPPENKPPVQPPPNKPPVNPPVNPPPNRPPNPPQHPPVPPPNKPPLPPPPPYYGGKGNYYGGYGAGYQYGVTVQRTANRVEPFSLYYDDSIINDYANWGYRRVNAAAALASGIDGSGVVIMVIDGGVSPHTEFKPGAVQTLDFTGTGPYDYVYGHGTSVIGVIISRGAQVKGVAPGATIYSAKADAGGGVLSSAQVIQAVNWAVEHNRTSPDKISIINLSYGVAQTDWNLADAIRRAYAAGITIVAPAGNDGMQRVMFPANMPEVIAVAGSTPSDAAYANTSYGAEVDFIAPGASIYTTGPNNTYVWDDGTSMAAPFVSGLAALAIQNYRLRNNGYSPTPYQVKQMLANASSLIPGANALKQGYGLPNAAYLIY